jgi:hypothetical protein
MTTTYVVVVHPSRAHDACALFFQHDRVTRLWPPSGMTRGILNDWAEWAEGSPTRSQVDVEARCIDSVWTRGRCGATVSDSVHWVQAVDANADGCLIEHPCTQRIHTSTDVTGGCLHERLALVGRAAAALFRSRRSQRRRTGANSTV